MNSILPLGTGRLSTFGGPADSGVGADEGLALVGPTDLAIWWYGSLFLTEDQAGAPGLARRLNPRAHYAAMRWDEVLRPHGLAYFNPDGVRNLPTSTLLRHALLRLTNPRNGVTLFARPVDYGPGDGRIIDGQHDPDTGRLIDLSPATAIALGVATDQLVTVELILPEPES